MQPLSGHTGAQIDGIDLSVPLTDAERRVVSDALARWKVVFFRGQDIGHPEQIDFAGQFGDLTYAHPYDDDPPEGFPEIYTMSPERFAQQYGITGEAAKAVRKRYSYTNEWHTDVTPAINPPAASVLRADVVPEYGGDTLFTNLVAAYEGLSDPVRRLVDELRAEHRYGAGLARRGLAPAAASPVGQPADRPPPGGADPPLTGERALFVNPGLHRQIIGAEPRREPGLLDLFFAEVTGPLHRALPLGARQRRLLGQPGHRPPRSAGHRPPRRGAGAAPRHPHRRGARRARRPDL